MHLSIAVARAVIHELEQQGISVELACARAGLDASQLNDATLRLPLDRARAVVAAAIELAPTPAIGLRVGESAPMAALNVVGHLMSSARTTRDALQLLCRYSELVFSGAGYFLFEEGGAARFVYAHPFAESPYERFSAEFALSYVLRWALQLSGPDKLPLEARFRYAEPSYRDEYERVFRCPLLFAQPANELIFAQPLLDLPQPHRDDSMCAYLAARAEHLLTRDFDGERLPRRVVQLLKLQLPATNVEQVAQDLGLPLRSLQRRLHARGLRLSQLLDEARCEVACASLRRPDATIKDVAFRIGFSELSAFYRAFRRWTGKTPAQFRQECESAA
jgi:AraC-like DNA-binding protein